MLIPCSQDPVEEMCEDYKPSLFDSAEVKQEYFEEEDMKLEPQVVY